MLPTLASVFNGLLLSVALGRLLGVKDFWVINLANHTVSIFVIIGLLGVRQVIVEKVSIAH
jgi:O-antigen/teichoic acid export membrane protein